MWVLLVGQALARTWSVPSEGTFTSVVAGASGGDIIEFDPGIYTDAPALLYIPLTLRGDPAGGTILQVPDRGAGPSISVTADLVLQDLTLDGLGATQILRGYDPATITLERVTMQHGVDPGAYGGAIGMDTATLTATDATFVGNTSHDGGAIWHNGTLLCTRCTFLQNAAVGDGGDGGGLWAYGPATLIEPVFEGNTSALWHGGALSIITSGDIYGGTFRGNVAALDGGALSVRLGASVTISPWEGASTLFEGNAALDGGAIGCPESCTLSVQGARFVANTAASDGGHISATQSLSMSIADSTLELGAASGDGGAVAVDVGPLAIVRTELCQNTASLAGGAVWSGDTVDLDNVSALYNQAGLAGGGLSVLGGSVSYSTALGNRAPDGSAVHGRGGLVGLQLAYTLLVDQADGPAVSGSAPITVTEGATWNNLPSDYAAYVVTVNSSLPLSRTPFPVLDPGLCEVPVPEWAGELMDTDPAPPYTEADPDGTEADRGATGGPLADPALWADADVDGAAAMWDCDDLDEQLFPPDCGLDTGLIGTGDTGLPDTGMPDTGPSDTSAGMDTTLDPPDPPPDLLPRLAPELAPAGAVGCGCQSAPGGVPWLLLLGLALRVRREAP
jgi:uncharacterized protein (TIGR03382 family)